MAYLARISERLRNSRVHESQTAAVQTGKHETIIVDSLIASESRISQPGLGTSIHEAGAECCLEAEVISALEAVPDIILPFLSSSLLLVFHVSGLRLSMTGRLLCDGCLGIVHFV